MVKDTDPVLDNVMKDLKRVTDVTRILDEQEKLNAPLPHYNGPMPGATNDNASNATANTTATANATATATPAAAPAEGAAPAEMDLPPELDPASAEAIQSKKSTAGNAT